MSERLILTGKRMLAAAARLTSLARPPELPAAFRDLLLDPHTLMDETWSAILDQEVSGAPDAQAAVWEPGFERSPFRPEQRHSAVFPRSAALPTATRLAASSDSTVERTFTIGSHRSGAMPAASVRDAIVRPTDFRSEIFETVGEEVTKDTISRHSTSRSDTRQWNSHRRRVSEETPGGSSHPTSAMLLKMRSPSSRERPGSVPAPIHNVRFRDVSDSSDPIRESATSIESSPRMPRAIRTRRAHLTPRSDDEDRRLDLRGPALRRVGAPPIAVTPPLPASDIRQSTTPEESDRTAAKWFSTPVRVAGSRTRLTSAPDANLQDAAASSDASVSSGAGASWPSSDDAKEHRAPTRLIRGAAGLTAVLNANLQSRATLSPTPDAGSTSQSHAVPTVAPPSNATDAAPSERHASTSAAAATIPSVDDMLAELYERLRVEFLRTYGTSGD